MPIPRLPLTFRQNLLKEIYHLLAAGKCGALVGVASAGKSRLVEFMSRPDVRAHYLGPAGETTLCLWIDGNDLLEHTEWGICEKILSALLLALPTLPGGPAQYAKVQPWYQQLTQPHQRPLARRLLQFALHELNPATRVVLLLDDFETCLGDVEDSTLAGLRALRDAFKQDNQYRLLYLLFTRKNPVQLREDPHTPGFESFVELFKNFVQPIGCYDRADALWMLQRLTEAYPQVGQRVTAEVADRLVEVTGGHAGLLDATFHSKTEAHWHAPDLARQLLAKGSVWNECNNIWEGLDEDHRNALYTLARGQTPEAEALSWLERSGLIHRDEDAQPITLELLRLYLNELAEQPLAIRLDAAKRELRVNDCAVALSEREFALAQLLHQHAGQWVTVEQLYVLLFPGQLAWASHTAHEEVQRAIGRLRAKLRKHCTQQLIIRHAAERGYQML